MKSHKNYYGIVGRNGFAITGNYTDMVKLDKYMGRLKHCHGFEGIQRAIEWTLDEYNKIQGEALANITDFEGVGELVLTKNLIKKRLAEKSNPADLKRMVRIVKS